MTRFVFPPLWPVLFFAVLLSASWIAPEVRAAAATKVSFNIAADRAENSLKRLAEQSGREVLFPSDAVEGVRTKAVKGEMTAAEAVDKMLTGTVLVAIEDVKTGSITVRREASVTEAEKNGGSRLLGKVVATEGPAVEIEKVEVTGSRIRSLLGEATPNPVFTWTREDFERSGVTSLGEFRNMVPQLGPTVGVGGNGFTGGNLSLAVQTKVDFDLRGLGNSTTLVLVNGRRMATGGTSIGNESFNPDGIPLSMVERIEVLTSGASALYGADAIAGVVNIILRKNYTGSEALLSYDNSFENDVAVKTVSLKTGYRAKGFSIMASATYRENNEQKQSDRWFTRPENRGTFGGTAVDVGGAGSITARTGNLPQVGVRTVAVPASADGRNVTIADYQGAGPIPPRFDLSPYFSTINPSKRTNALLRTGYEWTPAVRLFADVTWSEVVTRFTDRPFRATNLQIPAGYPGNPFGVPVTLSKIFFDLPRSVRETINRNSGVTVGSEGTLPRDWRYEVSGSAARSVNSDNYPTNVGTAINQQKFNAAIANPDPAQRPLVIYNSTIPGRNPNPPGRLESLSTTSPYHESAKSQTYNLKLSGPAYTLPAGSISVAGGYEYRKDNVHFLINPTDTFSLQTEPERSVSSGYAELQVPLYSEKNAKPFLRQLDVNVAGRVDSYSDFGSARTPRLGGLYRPVKWLAFRGSRSEGFRAPPIYYLNAPRTESEVGFFVFEPLIDPVRNEAIATDAVLVTGGNPDLRAERSVNYNWGAVLEVPFVQGLSLSVDYYDIDYRDKVEDLSFTLQALVSAFPSRLTRGPSTNGVPGPVIEIDGTASNTSITRTRGYDLQVSYSRKLEWGTVRLKAGMTKPDRYEYKVTPSDPISKLRFPQRISGTVTVVRKAVEASMAMNYQNHYFINPTQTYTAPSKIEWAPTVAYDFAYDSRFGRSSRRWWGRMMDGVKVTASVPNVFNRQMTVGDTATSGVNVYDPRLRRYVLTVRKQF